MKEHGNSVFVKINEYKEIMDVLDLVKAKVNEAKNTINDLNDLKNKEDSEIQKWAQTFLDIEAKIGDIDALMIKPTEL